MVCPILAGRAGRAKAKAIRAGKKAWYEERKRRAKAGISHREFMLELLAEAVEAKNESRVSYLASLLEA